MFKLKKIAQSLNFLTLKVRLAFIKLKQAFIKALILHYFDLEHHIRIEIDVSGYVIGRIFN